MTATDGEVHRLGSIVCPFSPGEERYSEFHADAPWSIWNLLSWVFARDYSATVFQSLFLIGFNICRYYQRRQLCEKLFCQPVKSSCYAIDVINEYDEILFHTYSTVVWYFEFREFFLLAVAWQHSCYFQRSQSTCRSSIACLVM